MKNPQQIPNENVIVDSQETAKKSFFQKIKSGFLNQYTALILGAGAATNCTTPEAPIIEDRDTIKPTIVLSNVNVVDNDGDGIVNDATGIITATDNERVVSTIVTAGGVEGYVNGNSFVVTNVPTGTHTLMAKAEDPSGNQGSASQSVEVEPPVPTVTIATPTITPITPDAVLDAATENTNIATVSFGFELDGQVKTADELRVLGYTVEFSLDNSAVKFDNNNNPTQIQLAEKLDRDGENNTDPENLKNLQFTAKAKVTKDGVSQETESTEFSDEKNETQDFTNEYEQLIELADGTTASEYTNTVNNYTDLIGNSAYVTDHGIIEALANASGSDFGMESIEVSPGFFVPFLTYNGQRVSSVSMSWLIEGAHESGISGQSNNMEEAIETGGLAEYLKKGLQNFDYVANTNSDSAHAPIMFSQLQAAKGGAGARVNQNIDNGAY